MKWPTFISQSNFLEKMGKMAFGIDNAKADYIKYLNKFKETIPDSVNNLQALSLKDSCHTDFGD